MSVTETQTAVVELPEPSERYELFAEWLRDNYGYEVDPAQMQVAIQRYGKFQRSDINRQANEAHKQARAQAEEERRQRMAERRAAAAAKREERAASAEAGKTARRKKKAQVDVEDDETDSEATVTVAKKKSSDKPRAARKTSEDAPF